MTPADIIDAIDEADPTGCAVWAIAFLIVALSALACVASVRLMIYAYHWGIS